MSRTNLGLPPCLLHWSLAPSKLPPPPPPISLLPPWAEEYDWVADGVFNIPISLPPPPPTPPVLPWPPGCSGCLSIRWGHVCVCLSALSPTLGCGAAYMSVFPPVWSVDWHASRDRAKRMARLRKATHACAALAAGAAMCMLPRCGRIDVAAAVASSIPAVHHSSCVTHALYPPSAGNSINNSIHNSNININSNPLLCSRPQRPPVRWAAGRRRAVRVPPLPSFLSACLLAAVRMYTPIFQWWSWFSPSRLPPPCRGTGWVPAEWLLPFDSVGLG